MPKRYSSTQILRVLEKIGFRVIRQKGSHIKLKNKKGMTTIVKANQKIIYQGTFLEILKQVGISRKEFEELIQK